MGWYVVSVCSDRSREVFLEELENTDQARRYALEEGELTAQTEGVLDVILSRVDEDCVVPLGAWSRQPDGWTWTAASPWT